MKMTLPNVPNGKIVDEKGNMVPEFKAYLMQLSQYLQTNLSNEGIVAPPLTTTEINNLPDALNGTIVYNETTQKLMGKEGGTGITGGAFANLI